MNLLTRFELWRAHRLADRLIADAEREKADVGFLAGLVLGIVLGGIVSWTLCGFTDRPCVVKWEAKR